jgi:hypothetical protein
MEITLFFFGEQLKDLHHQLMSDIISYSNKFQCLTFKWICLPTLASSGLLC